MQTPNTKTENRYSPAEQVVFIEYSTTQKGQHFMTVMGKENGRRKIVARIFREFDPVEKKMKYTAKDREGIEMFSDFNLYAMKKTFVDKAKELAKAIPAPEKNAPVFRQPEQKVEEKGEKKTIGKKIKDKAQEFTHSLVPDGAGESQNPEADKVLEGMKRESELKEMRSEKENGKEKGKQLTR